MGLEKEMAARSGTLAWRIPWTEEPGGLYSPWGRKSRTQLSDWTTTTSVWNLEERCWRTYPQGRNRDTDAEDGLGDTAGKESGVSWETSTHMHTLACKQTASEKLLSAQAVHLSAPRCLHMTQFCTFYGCIIFHCVYVPHLYPFICRWTSSLLPCPGYCK